MGDSTNPITPVNKKKKENRRDSKSQFDTKTLSNPTRKDSNRHIKSIHGQGSKSKDMIINIEDESKSHTHNMINITDICLDDSDEDTYTPQRALESLRNIKVKNKKIQTTGPSSSFMNTKPGTKPASPLGLSNRDSEFMPWSYSTAKTNVRGDKNAMKAFGHHPQQLLHSDLSNPIDDFYSLWRQLDADTTLTNDKITMFPQQKKIKMDNYQAMQKNLNKLGEIKKHQ